MKHKWNYNLQSFITILCVLFVLIMEAVICLPILKANSEYNPQRKDEKHYPNGTFIGKYAYVDDKGNPVHVKYYADDSSYGVELKSVKVLESSTNEPLLQATAMDIIGNNLEPFKVASDLLKINYRILGNEAISPYKYLNKEIGKIKTSKGDEASTDYKVFYQKELSAPKKCSKDKVKIYFDKQKRWVQNVNKKPHISHCNI